MVNSLDQKSSVKNKVLILLFTILTVFVVIVTSLYFLKFERDAIEHTAMNYEKIFINGLKKEINSKLSISTMIGLGISQNQKVINALKKEDYIALRKEIDTIQNSIKNNSDYSGVKFQLITKDIKTAFRTWRDKKGDDLRSVGIVAHAFESKKLVTAEAVGKSGYFIRTVSPVFDKNRNIVGAVSVHLGLGSVYRAYKKENMYYGLLLDRNVVGRNFKPSDIVINDNYVTASKKWFGNDFNNLAKSIDFKEMKELGYMLTDKYFISPMVAKDSKGRVIGKHLIGMDRSTFNEEVNTFENSILIVIALFTFIFLITMSIIYIFVNKSVITPLKEIQGGLNQFFRFINREERDTSYINISNNDEFGNMAGVINSNIDKTRKMIELDNELIKDAKIIINKVQNGWFSDYIEKSTTNHLLEEFKNDVNQMIKDIKQHFLDMNVILKEYSNYDYRRKLELNGIEKGGVLDTLLNNINVLRDSITDMLVNNKSNGLTLDNSSSILLKNVDELNKNSNETAASLEETAAALEEMTSNISHNTENIVKMSGYASTLTNSAKKGQDLANQTTTSMDEINGQVSSINEAITIIDQIAFQTNILSLNAAVEAATAGETGKGFAVVAQEVRSLASRSAEAASEIKKLVGNATDKANHGKTIADEMIIGYNDLNKNILETIELISDIENISKEQLTGIEQINGAINSLDTQTQQNASIATQTHSVATQTDSIAKLVVKNADEKEFEGKENIRGKEMDNFTNNNSNSSFEVRKSTKKATTYSSNSNNEWENF